VSLAHWLNRSGTLVALASHRRLGLARPLHKHRLQRILTQRRPNARATAPTRTAKGIRPSLNLLKNPRRESRAPYCVAASEALR
jgi:hypothetical protein